MLFLSGGANGQIEWNGIQIQNQNQIQILIPNAGSVHWMHGANALFKHKFFIFLNQ